MLERTTADTGGLFGDIAYHHTFSGITIRDHISYRQRSVPYCRWQTCSLSHMHVTQLTIDMPSLVTTDPMVLVHCLFSYDWSQVAVSLVKSTTVLPIVELSTSIGPCRENRAQILRVHRETLRTSALPILGSHCSEFCNAKATRNFRVCKLTSEWKITVGGVVCIISFENHCGSKRSQQQLSTSLTLYLGLQLHVLWTEHWNFMQT